MITIRRKKIKQIAVTFHRPSLARMRTSVSESIFADLMSGSDRRCDFRFLSPNARETASWPFTRATSPGTENNINLNPFFYKHNRKHGMNELMNQKRWSRYVRVVHPSCCSNQQKVKFLLLWCVSLRNDFLENDPKWLWK